MSDFNSNGQLFTDLTSEQAAIVEGGLTVTIHSIQCLKAGADGFFGGKDEAFIKSSDSGFIENPGVTATSVMSMDSGDSRTVNRTWRNFKNSLRIDLFDLDGNFGNSDDHMGGFTAKSTGGQVFSKRVSGSGSRYRIFYSAV
ncbi:MAG: hypothetical protein HY785_10430 [Oscillatoriophycideae cyanobacterium NC_groundwater_1537_Pr4_S-0.65um_50_18]|nr:hypothetical protein [Oscillatoriophycideae cyanobacterium NC_groundwater_1537_Pr4_S-0.65um_50_18]